MDRVAEDAGISKQTLYNYFSDKEDLFVALMQEEKTERLLAALSSALEHVAAGDVQAGLREAARVLISRRPAIEHIAVFRLVLEIATEPPDLTVGIRERLNGGFGRQSLDLIRDAIARGVTSGKLRATDPEVAARVFFGALAAYTLIGPAFSPDFHEVLPAERMADGIAEVLMNGLRVKCERGPD